MNESIFDYQIVKDQDMSKKERKIYFAAVEEILVFDYLEVLSAAKLKPIAIDIEPVSTARALKKPKKSQKKPKQKKKKNKKKKTENKTNDTKETQKPKEQPIEEIIKENLPTADIVLDIGAKHSVVTIYYNLHIFPSISIPIGGHTFTQIIQENLKSKDFEDAQNIKNKLSTKSEQYKKVKPQIESELDKTIKEIQSFISYFEKNNDIVVKTLNITGGSSKLSGLFDYIKENLSIDVKKAEAIIETNDSFDMDIYLNATGLALRGIHADPVTRDINLLPAHQKRLLVEQQAKTAIIYSSLVVLFVSSLLIASFNIVLSNLYFDLEGLEKANTSFQKIVEGTRYQEIQNHIQELNDNAQLAKQTLEETYSVKDIYNHFHANVPKAILINQFNYKNQENNHKIEVNGFALEREHVVELLDILKATPFYSNVVEPISNFIKQKDIYFFFSFDLDLVKFQEYLVEEKQKVEEEKKKLQEEARINVQNNGKDQHQEEAISGTGTTFHGTDTFAKPSEKEVYTA